MVELVIFKKQHIALYDTLPDNTASWKDPLPWIYPTCAIKLDFCVQEKAERKKTLQCIRHTKWTAESRTIPRMRWYLGQFGNGWNWHYYGSLEPWMFPMLIGSDFNFDSIQHTFSHLFREENVQSSTVFMTFLYYNIMLPNIHAFNKSTKSCW